MWKNYSILFRGELYSDIELGHVVCYCESLKGRLSVLMDRNEGSDEGNKDPTRAAPCFIDIYHRNRISLRSGSEY